MTVSFYAGEYRRRFIAHAQALRDDKGALLLVPAFAVYVAVWSYLTVLKFYALHATVFDLGLEMEQLWKFVHPIGFNATTYLLTALNQPFQFLLSPISLPLSYPLLLVVQSIGLGSGGFAVYGIAQHILKTRTGAYCLSLAYLLYFPIGGVNWFDFHAQAFFIPIFLWGFLCYLTRRYRFALVLLMLAAGTTYSYVLLVVLFSSLTVLELVLRRAFLKENGDSGEWKFALILLAASAAYFLYQLAVYSYLIGISLSQNAQLVAGSIPVLNRVEVMALLLVPTLFLPAFAPKWLAMLLPFSYLEFTSAASPFNFSAIFRIQFTALAIPFVFIGTIYGLRNMNRLLASWRAATEHSSPPRESLKRFIRRPRRSTSLAMTMLAVTIGCATVFQPYGPLNQLGPDNFGTATATSVNWTYFNEYTHLVSLIPADTPYVLFQNSMPSVLPRPLDYLGTAFVPEFAHWINVSAYDAASNRFPLEVVAGRLANVPLNFAISDPNNEWYSLGDNVSMFSFFTTLYQSRFYGLAGEASGMTVLARGYSGPLEYYQPFSGKLPSTDLYVGETGERSTGPSLSRANLSGQVAWHSPPFPLSPGTYRVAFSLLTSLTAADNSLSLVVLGNGTGPTLANQSVRGGNFTQPNVWTTVSLTVRLTTAYSQLQFAAWDADWNGTISVQSIAVTEVAPPTPLFSGDTSAGVFEPVAVPD
ncbi:MAG: DUF2079 domain-containing protein [Thermoplasmata archaeon]